MVEILSVYSSAVAAAILGRANPKSTLSAADNDFINSVNHAIQAR